MMITTTNTTDFSEYFQSRLDMLGPVNWENITRDLVQRLAGLRVAQKITDETFQSMRERLEEAIRDFVEGDVSSFIEEILKECEEQNAREQQRLHPRYRRISSDKEDLFLEGKNTSPLEVDLEDDDRIGLPELPLNCLPDKVTEVIKEIAHAFNTDYWMPFAAILKGVSAVVGANYMLRTGAYSVPAHQWLMLVCHSGSSKSLVTQKIFKPILKKQMEYDADWEARLKEYREKMEDWEEQRRKDRKEGVKTEEPRPEKPPQKIMLVNNVTIEKLKRIQADNPGGVLWENDEIASWIRGFDRYGNGSAGYEKSEALTMYEGQCTRMDRVKDEGTVVIPYSFLSVFGTTQPDILPTLISGVDFDSGFLQRFMFVCPQRRPPRNLLERYEDVDDRKIAEIFDPMLSWRYMLPEKVFNDAGMADLARDNFSSPQEVTLTPEAAIIHAKYIYEMEMDSFMGKNGNNKQIDREISRTSRWVEQYTRLVLILHCLKASVENYTDCPPSEISKETVEEAITIFRCIAEHGKYAWRIIEIAVFGADSLKNNEHLSNIKLIIMVKEFLDEISNDRYEFTYAKKAKDQVKSNFERLVEQIPATVKEEKTKKSISRRLERLGFRKTNNSKGVCFRIGKSDFNKLYKEATSPRNKNENKDASETSETSETAENNNQ